LIEGFLILIFLIKFSSSKEINIELKSKAVLRYKASIGNIPYS
jgi:hypothetical protein